jgi:hypothetical protein
MFRSKFGLSIRTFQPLWFSTIFLFYFKYNLTFSLELWGFGVLGFWGCPNDANYK